MLPQPVLIIGTYDKDGKPNAMNAAWGGQWDMHESYHWHHRQLCWYIHQPSVEH